MSHVNKETNGLTILKELKKTVPDLMQRWDACNFIDLVDGIQFLVSTSNHRGIIAVTKCDDVYRIQIGQIKKTQWRVLTEVLVPLEELGAAVDKLVGSDLD